VSTDSDKMPTLRAAIDRIIPEDDFPSASQAGVDIYITRLLGGDRKSDALLFFSGVAELDTEAKADGEKSFAECSAAVQDQILERVQAGTTHTAWHVSSIRFFDMLLNLTAEGYFSDPANGGNRDAISWKMVGYDPGANRP
jgi:hypothetical protein